MENEVDKIDLVAVVLYPIAAGVSFGVWALDVTIFGGWSPADTMFSAGGTSVTYGLAVALLAVAWIVGTNEIDGSDYETYEYGVIALGFLIVPLYEFVPAVQDVINSHDALRVVAFLLAAAVATYIAYLE